MIGEHAVLSVLPEAKSLDDLALQSRPDLIAAERAADRSHKAQALAKKAYVPDFTVSAGYMIMPSGQNMRNAYTLEGTMNAFGQIQESLVEAEAAQKRAHLYHDQLRPQAEATLQSSVIAYENDKTELLDLLDSQMSVVDIDLAWLAAVADFDARLADLELATGGTLPAGTSNAQSDSHATDSRQNEVKQ